MNNTQRVCAHPSVTAPAYSVVITQSHRCALHGGAYFGVGLAWPVLVADGLRWASGAALLGLN